MKKVILGLFVVFFVFIGTNMVKVQAAEIVVAPLMEKSAPAPTSNFAPAKADRSELVTPTQQQEPTTSVEVLKPRGFMDRIRSFFDNLLKFFSALNGQN